MRQQQNAQADVSSGTTPYSLGFRKSLKIQNGNQTSGAGAGDYVSIRYRLEAQDLAQILAGIIHQVQVL